MQDAGTGDYKERVLFRRMGVVMHYLADYFTFPHNVTYGGSLKDHCLYERDMKHALRSYVRTSEAQQIFRLQQMRQGQIRTANELFAYIERMHRDYLRHPHSAPGRLSLDRGAVLLGDDRDGKYHRVIWDARRAGGVPLRGMKRYFALNDRIIRKAYEMEL